MRVHCYVSVYVNKLLQRYYVSAVTKVQKSILDHYVPRSDDISTKFLRHTSMYYCTCKFMAYVCPSLSLSLTACDQVQS